MARTKKKVVPTIQTEFRCGHCKTDEVFTKTGWQNHLRTDCPGVMKDPPEERARMERYKALIAAGKSKRAARIEVGYQQKGPPMPEEVKQMLRERAAEEKAARPKRKRRRKAKR